MKKSALLSIFTVLLLSAAILSGCKKDLRQLSSYNPIGNTKSDTLRIYNLLPDISSDNSKGYLIYLNDSLNTYEGVSFFNGLVYGTKPAIAIPAGGGTFTIKLASYPYGGYGAAPLPPLKNPDPATVVVQKTIKVPPHSGYGNVVFYDSIGKPAVQYLPLASADPGAPAPGTFKIRVINFSYAMASYGADYNISPPQSAGPKYNVQLQYADSTVFKGNDNVPFSGVSAYQQVDYGTHQFLLYNLGTSAYFTNCGPLDDVLRAFDLSPILTYPTYKNNQLFPQVSNYQSGLNTSTIQVGNIGSYPFAAGCCYSVLVIGNMYSISLDRRYEPGVLDNFGKVQLVNVNPDAQDLEVKITYSGGQNDVPALPFGQYTQPLTVPAGQVNLSFISGGKTVYTYSTQLPRLTNYTLYYSRDLKGLPFVLPQSNAFSPQDYVQPSLQNPVPKSQLAKMETLDICPDAGPVFFTVVDNLPGSIEQRIPAAAPDVTYQNSGSNVIYDGTATPLSFGLRLSSSRPDSLAAKLEATLSIPFKRSPAPGSYTLVSAGLLNTTDPAKKIRLILVKHTNFTIKAK